MPSKEESLARLKARMGKGQTPKKSPPKSKTTPKAKVTPKPKARAKTPKSSGRRLSQAKTPEEKIALLKQRMGKGEGGNKSTPDSSRRQSAAERRRREDVEAAERRTQKNMERAEQAAKEARAAREEARAAMEEAKRQRTPRSSSKRRPQAKAANIEVIRERLRGQSPDPNAGNIDVRKQRVSSWGEMKQRVGRGLSPVYVRLLCVVLVAAVFFFFAPVLRAKFAASEIDGGSHYAVLGITAEDVQEKGPGIIVDNYRKKAKKLHPDKNNDVNDVDAFLQVQDAYEALKKTHADDFKAAKAAKAKRAEEAEEDARSKQLSDNVLEEDEVRSQMAVGLRRGRDMTNAGLGAVLGLSLAYGIEQVVGTRT